MTLKKTTFLAVAALAAMSVPAAARGAPLSATRDDLSQIRGRLVASLLPTALSVPAPVAMRTIRAWPAAEGFASVHATPSPEPPRA